MTSTSFTPASVLMPTHGNGTSAPFRPPTPDRLADLGIPSSLVSDLALRYIREHGTSTLTGLKRALRLSFPVVEAVFHQLRQQQFLDVKGMLGNDYSFSLTATGRALATERSEVCRYASAAPVSLDAYYKAVRAQSARVQLTRAALKRALADLVVTEGMLDQLGPALISQKSLFLYGPTGNGKTSFAERLLRVYEDTVMIPYAVEVDGHIVTLYDPTRHRAVEDEPDDRIDPRWVMCKRPCIIVGGELVPGMLELHLDESAGTYAAPLQMKANNGMLIIDDFGRQLMSPRDLLNRWIVPLDRRVDYLSLRYGLTFQIPFELMVVFSTNLEPSDLADEAFLRRIHNKIFVEPVQQDSFDQIFERVVRDRQIPCDPGMAAYLRAACQERGSTGLRACYPADICNLLAWIAQYERRPAAVNPANVDRAVELYFTRTLEVRDE